MAKDTTRLKVDIKYDSETQAFRAYYPGTNEPVLSYSNLVYGKTDTGNDDPVECMKTLKDGKPDKAAACIGFVTVRK